MTTKATDRLPNVHPGDVLREDYLIPLEITAYKLAKATHLSQTHIGDITRGERSVTALTALRLSEYFGTSPQFWLNLQNAYDLEEAQFKFREELASIEKHPRTIEAEREMQTWESGERAETKRESLVLA